MFCGPVVTSTTAGVSQIASANMYVTSPQNQSFVVYETPRSGAKYTKKTATWLKTSTLKNGGGSHLFCVHMDE